MLDPKHDLLGYLSMESGKDATAAASTRADDGIQITVNRLCLTCGATHQISVFRSPLLAYTAVVLAQNPTHSFLIPSFATSKPASIDTSESVPEVSFVVSKVRTVLIAFIPNE